MDPEQARRLLQVRADAGADELRAAYRRLIGEVHPDRHGPGRAGEAALLNEAYAVLVRAGASRTPPLSRPPAPRPPPPPPPAPPPFPAEVLDGDTVFLAAAPDEAFALLLEACWRIGEVTYVDRSCSIIETVLRVEPHGTCSLLITLQGRGRGTEAFCTLEAIERVAHPPVGPVTDALRAALAALHRDHSPRD
jgi:hypothetical protein